MGSTEPDMLTSTDTKHLLLKVHRVFKKHDLPYTAFSLGVANLVLKSFITGACPGCVWLYCLIQWPFLLFLVAKIWIERKYVLYFAEFCWVANFFGWIFLASEALTAFSGFALLNFTDLQRLQGARMLFGIANGPLALALLMNANALVFHDPERTASFFIHFSPALVSWTMRWFQPLTLHEIAALMHLPFSFQQEREGSLFAINHEVDAESPNLFYDLYMRPWLAYFIWWVCYALWLLYVGYDLPFRGWGRSSFRDFQPKIQTAFGARGKRAEALIFVLCHLSVISLVLLLPRLLYSSFLFHSTFLVVLLLSGINHGGGYYHHAFGLKLEKAIDTVVLEEGGTCVERTLDLSRKGVRVSSGH